ncbi:unnamed protein product, partial [marine sediment metagenome]
AADENANVGASCQLRAVLEMDGGVYFVTQRLCVIAAPPPPLMTQDGVAPQKKRPRRKTEPKEGFQQRLI